MTAQTWIDVIDANQLAVGERAFLDLPDGTRVAVFNLNNEFYAIESMCTHAMFELDDAPIEGDNIICPLHGAKFCIKTGQVCTAPAYEDLRTFAVRNVDGKLQVLAE
jgi:3-phenylpropionate/trans-cinnamate dioxygenase ferredoxin component